MKGILGIKIGMTQVFSKSGKLTPVTAVLVEPNIVTQVKTLEKDGYEAVQLGIQNKKEKRSNKPEVGHVKKANTTPKRFLKEIRGVDVANYTLGGEVKADIFSVGEVIDVTGTSKGKGFQGAIKRHNQSRGPMSHGSHYHRRVGSMGPMRNMRVPKGKNLPGQMGGDIVTIQNSEIVAIDLENNIVLVKGNVPGAKKSLVIIRTAVKNSGVVNNREELIDYTEATPVETTLEETATDVEQVEEALGVTDETEVKEEQTEEIVPEEGPQEEVLEPEEVKEEVAEETKE